MSLVQTLAAGPVDVVGDIHGDFEALTGLLGALGYSDGIHPRGRKLVFVGDFVDRGPDSPRVVAMVRKWMEQGLAQAVLGNHELNLLLGKTKDDNGWFYGAENRHPATGEPLVQRPLAANEREGMLEFFRSLPLVLVRDDLRVVHACWEREMVDTASLAANAVDLYQRNRFHIELGLAKRSDLKSWQRDLRLQNLNPVKVLTSGLEVREFRGDKKGGRSLVRFPWWREYTDEAFCVFGHYGLPLSESRDTSRAVCVDFGNSKRWFGPSATVDPQQYRLGAFRFPEVQFVFGDGTEIPWRDAYPELG